MEASALVLAAASAPDHPAGCDRGGASEVTAGTAAAAADVAVRAFKAVNERAVIRWKVVMMNGRQREVKRR